VSRTADKFFGDSSKFFPVMLLTGARQTGKTTFLRRIAEKKRVYVTLDDPLSRENAKNDPRGFLQSFPAPALIDEIQYAPELLPYIKMAVDESGKPGMFWLTGSQRFHMMKGVTESLAGRVGIAELMGLSNRELLGLPSEPFLPAEFSAPDVEVPDTPSFFRKIWLGSFPRLALGAEEHWRTFYASYTQTYLERDVRALTQVGDLGRFLSFLKAAAARTGGLVNYSDLARDADISTPTAKSWLSVLETSGLVYLLPPFHRSISKRIVKAPKLYFLDTGLCAYLTEWRTPEVLAAGAMAGAFFESWCFAEILKSYRHNGETPPFYFHRDRDGAETDLLIERDGVLHPVEFKKTASPKTDDIKNFRALSNLKLKHAPGALICMRPSPSTLSGGHKVIPASML
jgi:predicted AAA+ superfamily ATPase